MITPFSQYSIPKEAIEGLKEKVEKDRREKETLAKLGIHINYVNPIEFKGGKVWAIGSRVYHSRPVNETFHEFIIDVLRMTLGKEWWEENYIKEFDEQHFIMQCYKKYSEWCKKNISPDHKVGDIWAAQPDGWSRSLISIAFDVATLLHAQDLPEHLLNRLKNRNEFQGARYEIALAAIFARLGCEIKFLDEETQLEKHPEFIASHKRLDISIAVEAKSKHRSGVLHFPGEPDEIKQLKGKVIKLFHQALEKETNGLPYFIFIDVNSPLTPGTNVQEKSWARNTIEARKQELEATPDDNPKYNAIYFTNFSYHYTKDDVTPSGEFFFEFPLNPQVPLPDNTFVNMLYDALSNYGNVPNIDYELSPA